MDIAFSQRLKAIRRLHMCVQKDVKGLLAGLYRSVFKGRGIEFENVREYHSGDEVRTIDWNVTARLSSPYVKLFRSERELTLILMMDISGSTSFTHTKVSKRERMSEIGALLASSAIENHDRVGLILFSSDVEYYLPPGRGEKHLLRMIREMLYYTPKNRGSALDPALTFLSRIHKKEALCVLLSDFIIEPLPLNLTSLAKHRNHQWIVITVQDPYDSELPSGVNLVCQDLETGKLGIVCTGQKQPTLPQLPPHIPCLTLSTDENPFPALVRFLRKRNSGR